MDKQKNLIKIRKTINENYHDYPIIKYLKIIQPSWTKIFAIKMIRTRNVLINDKKTSINYKLQTGDTLKLTGISNKFHTKTIENKNLKPLRIIFENEQLIIVNKEAKIATQPDEKYPINNMNNRLLKHLNFQEKTVSLNWKPTFIHRLDYNTTGLLIGAKTYQAYKDLTKAMKENKIEKYYKAICKGFVEIKNNKEIIQTYLTKKDGKVIVSNKKTPESKIAKTQISLINYLSNQSKDSLLDIKLITGRTHQIRAHLSYINHPIRGDQKYGAEKDKKLYPYPALVAYKIHFSKEIEGETIKFLKNKTFELKKEDIWFETQIKKEN